MSFSKNSKFSVIFSASKQTKNQEMQFFLSFPRLKKRLLYSIFLAVRSVELNQSLQNHDPRSEEDDVVSGFLEELIRFDVLIVDRNETPECLQLVGNLRARISAIATASRTPPYSATEASV